MSSHSHVDLEIVNRAPVAPLNFVIFVCQSSNIEAKPINHVHVESKSNTELRVNIHHEQAIVNHKFAPPLNFVIFNRCKSKLN